jgi:catechol 2,3-dioxygenase-like lactoylglutathione lyase family enzyme
LDVITWAVADLELALAFYCRRLGFECAARLGFESNGIVGTELADEVTGANGAIAMFRLEGGLLLNLYPRADLAKDPAIPVGLHKAASSARNGSSSRPAARAACGGGNSP